MGEKPFASRLIGLEPKSLVFEKEGNLSTITLLPMRESHAMQQSAENNTTGKTMGGLVKRNALLINKAALRITTRAEFGPTHQPLLLYHYTQSHTQSLPVLYHRHYLPKAALY